MTLDFSLSPEQEEIRKLAHQFAEKEIRPVAAHYDESEEFPYEIVKKAHKLGLTPAAFIPEEYGGQGLDFLTELVLTEELSWGCAGIGVCIHSMGLAIAGIRASGTEEQKKRWLPEFTNPDKLKLGGLGLTERTRAQTHCR
jgi:alkylation response protein AidB-like acyl-CoA dehydrogenase